MSELHGRMLHVRNVGTGVLVLRAEGSGSTAQWRLADHRVLRAWESVTLLYDAVAERWRIPTGTIQVMRVFAVSHVHRIVCALAVLAAVLVSTPLAAQTVEYYHLDAIGSVRAVSDQNGALLSRRDYLPFGEEWSETSSGHASRQFTGKERDAETGLDYFGARYYRAPAGRFTTIDPVYTWQENLVDPQRWNRYAYVRNNPLRYTDPDGRCIDGCVLEFAAVMIGAKITTDVAVYLNSPQGQQQLRDIGDSIHQTLSAAADGIRSWFATEKRAGTLGKPDHQQTAAEEAARIGGEREVRIETPDGRKGSRKADAARRNPDTGAFEEIVQVYRPTPRGNIPKREVDAAADIEKATGVKPQMAPVRPVKKPDGSND